MAYSAEQLIRMNWTELTGEKLQRTAIEQRENTHISVRKCIIKHLFTYYLSFFILVVTLLLVKSDRFDHSSNTFYYFACNTTTWNVYVSAD